MADNDTRAPDALEPASPQGGQPEPASDGKVEGESEAKQEVAKKVNWQDDPKYKEQQAEQHRAVERAKQEAAQAKQEAEATRKRLQALEDQVIGKDDYGKLNLYAQRQAEEAETLRRRLAELEAERAAESAKSTALKEIADEFEVPVSVLADATDYKHAMKLARTERDRRLEAKLKGQDERREANRPDVGGGRTSTPASRWDQEYDDAQKQRDSPTMMRLLREKERKKD